VKYWASLGESHEGIGEGMASGATIKGETTHRCLYASVSTPQLYIFVALQNTI